MSKIDDTITKYAIVINKTNLRLHLGKDTPTDEKDSQEDIYMRVDPGKLLKVFQTKTLDAAEYSTVQVLDFVHHNPIYDNGLFECLQTDMQKVSEDLWPYIISINDAGRRLSTLQDQEHCRWAIYLKKNDFVSVPGNLFGRDNSERFDCIIRYIGPVQELHPVGYCFGLELLTLDHGYSPQADDIPFSNKYIDCDPKLSMFTTADQIIKFSNEDKKSFWVLDLITDSIEKARNATGYIYERTMQYLNFSPQNET